MHCLLAPAVSVVNCLFMTWNGFFDLPLALLLEGEERVRSDPFLRVKNIVALVACAAAPLFLLLMLLFTWPARVHSEMAPLVLMSD